MSNIAKLKALTGNGSKRHHQRTLNALLAVLDMVTADGDPNDPDSLDHADDLLVGLGRAIEEGRMARMRLRSENQLKGSRARNQERLEDELNLSRILGKAPTKDVLLDELHKARAAGDVGRARTLERAILGIEDASPALIDPAQRARDKQDALDKAERERAGMPPARPVERKPNHFAVEHAAFQARLAKAKPTESK